jgi:hypothetical protein
MGIFSTMGAMFGPAGVAIGAGADMFLSSDSEGGGGVGATSRQVRPEVAATFAEMGSLSAEFTARMKDERARGRQKTESQDPTAKMVANILSSENDRKPGLEEYFKRLA